MAKVKIELNSPGLQALLKGQDVENCVKAEADRIAANAGGGYATDTKQMPGRVIASVYTTDEESMKDNLENDTLLRCL